MRGSAEEGPGGIFTINIDTESGLKIGESNDDAIDVSELPNFVPSLQRLDKVAAGVLLAPGC